MDKNMTFQSVARHNDNQNNSNNLCYIQKKIKIKKIMKKEKLQNMYIMKIEEEIRLPLT